MKKTLYLPDKFALYKYSVTDMDEYHEHIYDSFGETNWQILMYAFIDSACIKCSSELEAKELIDDFIYELIQQHYNT